MTSFTEDTLILTGIVAAGRGIAAKTVTHDNERIKNLLGAAPYPGTLNVVMNCPFVLHGAIAIDGKKKKFAVQGHIHGIPCLVYRWHGAPLHVAEIIAASGLRETLGLANGQPVSISLSKEKIKTPRKFRARLWELFYRDRPLSYYNEAMYRILTGRGIRLAHKHACQSKKEFL